MVLLKNEIPQVQGLFVLCMLVNCLYAGVLFGWAPLQLLLIKDGVFADRCEAGFDTSGGESCDAQLELINLLYTVGSTASIVGSVASGFVLDNYGFLANCCTAGLFSFSGFLLFALSPSYSLILLLLSVIFIGTGGIFSFFCAFGISSIVLKSNIPLVLTGANVFFDCSAVIPLLFYQLFDAGYSRKSIFLSYSLLAIIVYGMYIVMFQRASMQHSLQTAVTTAADDSSVDSVASNVSAVLGIEIPHKEHKPRRARTASNVSDISEAQGQQRMTHEEFITLDWKDQLKTKYFLYISCFTVVMMLRSNIYLGTVQILLEDYNDDEHDYLFTQLFIAMLPFGFLFIPSIDYMLKNYGFATFNNIVSVLGLAYGVLAVIPVLYLQVLTFALYTAYRACFYSVVATFNACVFGNKNAGRIHGFSFLVAGVVNLAQWPIMLLVFKYEDGNLFNLYLALILICIPSLLHTEMFLRPSLLLDDNDVIEREGGSGAGVEETTKAEAVHVLAAPERGSVDPYDSSHGGILVAGGSSLGDEHRNEIL